MVQLRPVPTSTRYCFLKDQFTAESFEGSNLRCRILILCGNPSVAEKHGAEIC